MSKIYEVRSFARGDGKLHSWGAFELREAAEKRLLERTTGEREAWAAEYHREWWIEEIDTTGLFEIPPKPTPRERFIAEASTVESTDGTWNTLKVDVKEVDGTAIASYARNYSRLYQTFEPFRQGDRHFALISNDYTRTAVLDLQTGQIIASEEPDAEGYDFCPVGFYVPDWWDLHDGSILPGSTHWSPGRELPKGDFGFVWGCMWGDDSSWKVQYLDLSAIQDGRIQREERFGYLRLASHPKLVAKDFIRCYFRDGQCTVTFAVEQSFDLATGRLKDDDD